MGSGWGLGMGSGWGLGRVWVGSGLDLGMVWVGSGYGLGGVWVWSGLRKPILDPDLGHFLISPWRSGGADPLQEEGVVWGGSSPPGN